MTDQEKFSLTQSLPKPKYELKPCPFCGNDGKLESIEIQRNEYGAICVCCMYCGATGGCSPEEAGEEYAVSQWNRREGENHA